LGRCNRRLEFMRYFLFVILSAIALFTACKPETATISTENQKRFPIQGKVISVDSANKKVELDHNDIPGFMDAMTMKFPIRNADWVFAELVKDADVRAELVVDNANGEYWLENVGIVVSQNPNAAPSATEDKSFAKTGQPLPDFKLTNQDGKLITLKDFNGKAFAITFIYARCPLPDYCIKMSTNFSDATNLLKESDMKDKIKLLTISFDPENDTPAKLRQYGIGYLGKDSKPNFDIWQIAVGKDSEIKTIADFIGLRFEKDENDKTQINHSLRTIIVSPDGKVSEIISGNEFTPQDLIRKLTATIK
jgi:protein SCO1